MLVQGAHDHYLEVVESTWNGTAAELTHIDPIRGCPRFTGPEQCQSKRLQHVKHLAGVRHIETKRDQSISILVINYVK